MLPNATRIELHIFCDASETAYAASAYIVSFSDHGDGHAALLCSRTRVAPVKAVSLPRLELCAAHLGAKLAQVILQSLASSDTRFDDIVCWSDSTVVLCWLRDLPRRWVTFVANRVSFIQETLPNATWRHVPTAHNPADIASRGATGNELLKHSLWWHGPSWLARGKSDWPLSPDLDASVKLEARKQTVTVTVAVANNDFIPFERFSKLPRLVRTIAYVHRFAANLKFGPKLKGPLSVSELENAKNFLLRSAQSNAYAAEINALRANRALLPSSKLLQLSPFLDKTSGLLLVGGRLKNSDLDFASKHPPLLPANCRLSLLFALHAHHECSHGGPQLTHAKLQQSVWIINARSLVRSVISHCTVCFRYSRTFKPPIMGELPSGRVTPSRPFSHCGVDYAGPFTIKSRSGRGCKHSKAYLALFVCFSTKALHLELASDMTTKTFLAAFRRFVSRRGLPSVMYSDNGTNFTGAANELKTLVKQLSVDEDLFDFSAQRNVVWKFNPPAAPHFGGLWEAGVKGVKAHLKRIVGNSVLTFEELTTVLAQIEACLNSRPLTLLSSDPNDLRPLTPGHFLTGDSLLATPSPRLLQANSGSLRRWDLVQKMVQDFWARWRHEYLNTLQLRKKWHDAGSELHIGDVVLLTDESAPSSWPLALVQDLHPGADGVARVATVRVGDKTYRRSLHRLRRLPLLNQSVQGGRYEEDRPDADLSGATADPVQPDTKDPGSNPGPTPTVFRANNPQVESHPGPHFSAAL